MFRRRFTELPKTTPILESDVPKSLPKPNIPYPSRRDDQKSRDKASNQMEKIFQSKILFMICALRHYLRYRWNEDILLTYAPQKASRKRNLEDTERKMAFLPEIYTNSAMTLELADRSITYPKGLAEDVFVKVGKFHFPTDFVVVDFEADPRVPLILGRSFLRTGRALIDVYGEEITLRVDNEAVTFNLDQTTRYSSTNDKSVNRIDIIDAVCEEYAPELLGFPNSSGGNPTPTSEPFTSEFILEEIEAYLKDDSISPKIDHADCDPEEDICLIEKLLNNDPFQLPPMDLKQSEVTEAKSLIEEPPELELKDLPSHLEYAFLEENDKLPVIIAKGLKNDEKDALLKVLKSHERAIASKITDIKGIDPRFCTHKILMEDDYKPTIQSQRRVNPKIHEVIKKEVLKLLDAGMIYPISDIPWVSPMHCVPKKGGITVVANEENELFQHFSIHKVRVCIDYRKLNEATRKDHFPLPFMDQINVYVWGVTSSPSYRYYHPQTSDQVEVSNRGLKHILERTVGENCASWFDKLDDALWAFCTAFKTPIGCTPYKLVYENSCHLPIELEHKAYWALKHANFDLKTAGDHRKLQLNELNELRDQAYENSLIYKERTKKLHDSKIKNRIFNVGDRVLLFNSRLKIFSGKLKTHWSGPFTNTKVFP
ncbi:reverse transcriptase domain-containing protein [Tanacetum coccineum]